MPGTRRYVIPLLVVFTLVGVVWAVIAVQNLEPRLGLDLRGGASVTFVPTNPQGGEPTERARTVLGSGAYALTETERSYLAGFLTALDASPPAAGEVPVVPGSAPLAPSSRAWFDGVLAGLSSRAAAPAAGGVTIVWGSQTSLAVGLIATARVPAIDNFNFPIFLIIFPMFLFSGTFFPIENLPIGVRYVASVLPLTHIARVVRAATLGRLAHADFLTLAGLLAATLLLAPSAYANDEAPTPTPAVASAVTSASTLDPATDAATAGFSGRDTSTSWTPWGSAVTR